MVYGAGEGCGGADRRRRRAGDEEPGRLPTPTRSFAFVWRPGQYPERARSLRSCRSRCRYQASSDRFKSVAHPSPKVWMHHLELDSAAQVDDEVSGWLAAAYRDAT